MDGALYLQARAIPLTQFNRLTGLGFDAEEDAIERALGRFREAGIRQAWCQVAPGPASGAQSRRV